MASKSEKPEEKDPKGKSVEGEGAAAAAAPQLVDDSADPGDPLQAQILKLTAEKNELRDTLLRRQADYENYRKRVEKERQQERHRGVEHMVEQMLPVLDAFDNALAAAKKSGDSDFLKGFELIRRQLWDALSKQGLARIESVGKEFDPHVHHAIATVETAEQADGTVVVELQPGYTFHERVLRPAMVKVAAQPAHSKQN